jgi:hypothetical protein
MADPKQQQQPTGAENKGGGLWDKIRGWLGRGSGPAQEGPTAPRGVTHGAEIAGKHQDNPLLAKDGYTGALALQTGGNFDANSPVAQALQLSDDLMQRYRDAEDMDDYDLTSSIFTLYADDVSIPDSNTGRSIWASSKDKLVRDVLEDLLTRRLRVEDDVHGLARTLGKYGNRFGEVLVGKQGVVGINFLAPPTMRRVQDNHGTTLGFIQDPTGQFKLTQREFDAALKVARDQRKPVNGCVVFEPWEIVHWRLRQKDTTAVYGVSVLDGGRWAWKRLMMMEDTALVTKLTRGPSRNAFYIDTGDLPPAEGWAHVKKIQQQYSRKKVFNPTTNQIDFRYNVQSSLEDLWLPTRGGKDSTRVDVLQGVDSQDLDILEYFRNKVLAAAQTPKRLLGMEETTGRIASGDDVRFARAAMRVQREVRNGMKQICRVHLAALGIDPDAVAFDLHMTVPSYIFELAQLEVRLQQAQLAQGLGELVPQPWILQHVFGFSQDEAIYVTDEARKDKRGAMKGDAATQAEIIREYPETVMGPMGAEGGLPPEVGAAEGAVPEGVEDWRPALDGEGAVKARLDRLLNEHGRVTRLTERMAARVEGIDRAMGRQDRQARRDRRAASYASYGRKD